MLEPVLSNYLLCKILDRETEYHCFSLVAEKMSEKALELKFQVLIIIISDQMTLVDWEQASSSFYKPEVWDICLFICFLFSWQPNRSG